MLRHLYNIFCHITIQSVRNLTHFLIFQVLNNLINTETLQREKSSQNLKNSEKDLKSFNFYSIKVMSLSNKLISNLQNELKFSN